MRRLSYFPGGVKLRDHKRVATAQPVKAARLPKKLVLPLQQHIGEPALPIVAVGDRVLKGQLIAKPADFISSPVHASSSGTVVAITNHNVQHPSGLEALCIIIETDGKEEWRPRQHRIHNYIDLTPDELRELIRNAGIVGMGGAGFPSDIKLNPDNNPIHKLIASLPSYTKPNHDNHPIHTLILNGAECEPYITCDEMLLREHALEIIVGMRMMKHTLGADKCIIGIENNKRSAFLALQEQARNTGADFIEVVQVPTVYPAGGEKQLIQVLTGKEVPAGGLPRHIGVVCHNIGTAYAVYRAIEYDEPLISRYVTIAGSVASARNLEVLIGTPVADLIDECGGNRNTLNRVIMGGPMMGIALHNDDVPVIKTTNCILVNSTVGDVPLPSRDEFAMPCIRCGSCAISCPVSLLPQQLYWYARAKDFDKVQDYHLFDCIECGCCDYVCPSQIPLIHYFRYAKTEIWAQELEKKLSDIARDRHQFRELRIEREKHERAERHKKKRAVLNVGDNSQDAKKVAIQAAVERAKAKRETSSVTPKNIDNLTLDQEQKIAEADARRNNNNEKIDGQ